MKLGSSLWYLALSAGLAVLALTGGRVNLEPVDDVTIDVDAWFV